MSECCSDGAPAASAEVAGLPRTATGSSSTTAIKRATPSPNGFAASLAAIISDSDRPDDERRIASRPTTTGTTTSAVHACSDTSTC